MCKSLFRCPGLPPGSASSCTTLICSACAQRPQTRLPRGQEPSATPVLAPDADVSQRSPRFEMSCMLPDYLSLLPFQLPCCSICDLFAQGRRRCRCRWLPVAPLWPDARGPKEAIVVDLNVIQLSGPMFQLRHTPAAIALSSEHPRHPISW
jgi:hypothetical protein